ncbi:MAG: 1-phosphofructokinase family hexose kinase [Eubacteriaceae bacterium]|jgi:tagatose 6-phosphate kinase
MITTVTLNASVDKAYHMDRDISGGEVMRVTSCRNSAGGKGLNVARIVRGCGEDVTATGLTGGYNGAYLESMLDQDGIKHQFAHIAGETRSCINILDKAFGSTEFLEPGCEVTSAEESSFLNETYKQVIEGCEVVTLSGSIPVGMSTSIYQKLIRIASGQGKQVILDTSGLPLKKGISACPTMVKPNKEEIEALYHITLDTIDDVVFYAKKIAESGISYVVVSLGKEGALMVCEDGVFQAIPPAIEAVNTVGCGDSMVGAFAVALQRGYYPRQALVYAVAVASANAASPETGTFDTEVYQDIVKHVRVKSL